MNSKNSLAILFLVLSHFSSALFANDRAAALSAFGPGPQPVAPATTVSPQETPASFCQNQAATAAPESRQVDAQPADQRFLSAVRAEAVRIMRNKEQAFRGESSGGLAGDFQNAVKEIRKATVILRANVMVSDGRPTADYVSLSPLPLDITFRSMRGPADGLPTGEAPSNEEKLEFEKALIHEVQRPNLDQVRQQFSRDFASDAALVKQRYVPALENAFRDAHRRLKEKATRDFDALISRNPLYAYLPNANPTPSQITAAREKYANDLATSRKKLDGLRVSAPEAQALSQFSPAVLRVLRLDPGLCSAYTQVSEQLRAAAKARHRDASITAIASNSACAIVALVSLGWGSPCFLVSGTVSAGVALEGASGAQSELEVLRNGARAGQVQAGSVHARETERNALIAGGALNAATAAAVLPGAIRTLQPIGSRILAQADALNSVQPANISLLTNNGGRYNYNGRYLPMIGSETHPGVIYLREEAQRAPYMARFQNGRILQSNGQPFFRGQDPGSLGAVAPQGRNPLKAIFVIDKEGRMMLNPGNVDGRFHHSSFVAGDNVVAAGEIFLTAEGRVSAITNGSGHYLPSASNAEEVIRYLQAQGIQLNVKSRKMKANGVREIRFAP